MKGLPVAFHCSNFSPFQPEPVFLKCKSQGLFHCKWQKPSSSRFILERVLDSYYLKCSGVSVSGMAGSRDLINSRQSLFLSVSVSISLSLHSVSLGYFFALCWFHSRDKLSQWVDKDAYEYPDLTFLRTHILFPVKIPRRVSIGLAWFMPISVGRRI